MTLRFASVRRRLALGAFIGLLLSPIAGAIDHEVRILLDLDDDPGTGCLVSTVDGPFDGVEQILVTTVETSSPPEMAGVVDAALSDCLDAVLDTFGPAVSFDTAGWPVGVGNGVGGFDVVETYVPLVELLVPQPDRVRLGVVLVDETGREEALLTVDHTPAGEPIRLPVRQSIDIPTLGEWGLVALCLLLASGAVWALGPRGAVVVLLVLVVAATGAGVAWAAGILDGLTGDWSSSDQLASNGIVLFGKPGAGEICFRADVMLAFNSPPDAVDDGFAVDEDSSDNSLPVLGNDSDPDSDPFSIVAVGTPDQGGTATTDGTTITYTPAPDFWGVETFTYTIEDSSGASGTATVTVTVTNVNDPPTAVDDAFTVDEDSIDNPLDVLANDTDAPDGGETLTITGVGATDQGGTAITDGSTITYTPAADFAGAETFTYTISDGNGGTDTATVTMTVTDANPDPPVCAADSATTDEDSSTLVSVLANDTDPDPGQTATLTVLSVDTTGTTGMVTNNGTDVTYDPNGQFEGLGTGEQAMDAFSYTAQDSTGLTCMATVTVTVTGVNDAPMVNAESADFARNLEGVVESAPGESAAPTGNVFRTVADHVLLGDGDAEGAIRHLQVADLEVELERGGRARRPGRPASREA